MYEDCCNTPSLWLKEERKISQSASFHTVCEMDGEDCSPPLKAFPFYGTSLGILYSISLLWLIQLWCKSSVFLKISVGFLLTESLPPSVQLAKKKLLGDLNLAHSESWPIAQTHLENVLNLLRFYSPQHGCQICFNNSNDPKQVRENILPKATFI